jgi:hypothetical protein
MRNLYIIILLFSALFLFPDANSQDLQAEIQNCALNTGKDAIYLKDFIVKLEAAKPNQKPPVFRTTMALRKGVIYRLSVCNNANSEGQSVLRLYDESVLLLSTYNPESGKEYKAVNFECKKSGAYTIAISTKDGKAGEAIGILAYVNR